MVIIHLVICTKNIWKLGRILNYIGILQPVCLNVFIYSLQNRHLANKFFSIIFQSDDKYSLQEINSNFKYKMI